MCHVCISCDTAECIGGVYDGELNFFYKHTGPEGEFLNGIQYTFGVGGVLEYIRGRKEWYTTCVECYLCIAICYEMYMCDKFADYMYIRCVRNEW